jgi:outer membrane protein assembly factor BamE (lipoprotein component of BamABCDE complex)
MPERDMRPITAVGLTLALVGALFSLAFSLCFWFGEGHGASLSTLAKVRPGMTGERVVDLLGRPSTINRSGDGSESWYYWRWTFCDVKVHMTPEGVVEDTEHDH